MKQINQIGKYTKKEDYLLAKKGKTFVTPKNRSYIFDYIRNKSKYLFVIEYLGTKMQIAESDFNKTNIDDLLDVITNGLAIN